MLKLVGVSLMKNREGTYSFQSMFLEVITNYKTKTVTWQWKRLTNTTLIKQSKLTSPIMWQHVIMSLQLDVLKTWYCLFLAKIFKPNLIMRNIRQIKLRKILHNVLPILFFFLSPCHKTQRRAKLLFQITGD